jgi:HK97 family phage major capsid protein
MRINPREIWAVRQAALAALVAMVGIRAEGEDATIVAYRRRQEELVEASNNILAAADTESRELTVEERRTISDNSTEVERLEEEIGLRNRVAAQDDRMRQPQQRRTPANAGEPLNAGGNDDEQHEPQQRPQARGTHIQTTHIPTPATRAAARGNGGFNTLGHFAQAVRNGCISPGNMDGRLRASLTTYGSEGVGADGGFAVPPDFRTEIMRQVMAEESLFSRCDATPTNSNSVTVPTDETTPWSTSGVRVYTRTEAVAMTQSKPQLKDISVRLHETYAFVPMTDELLQDVPMMTAHLTTKSGEALQFALNNYIINGTGVGQMLGILNAGCLVSVAAEGSQTTATIHAENIKKMWGRMPGSVRSQAVWLVNQDLETQLMSLGFPVVTPSGTATGGMPLFVPPGGLSEKPYGTLLGRPVIVTEACSALGTKGDIILAYLPGYFAPFKSGGVKSDVSMHLFFDQGITCFRWTMRTGGQPWLSAPIARKNGSNTLSHFVTLDNR